MRYLLALLLLTATTRAAQVADVRYTFSDFTTSPSSVRRVQITPIQGYNATGSTIITGDRRTFTNDSSGVLIVSNVVVGASYRVDLNGQYTVTSFTNTFPSGTTGLVEAVDYISVPTNAAGTVAYSMASSDNRYATPAQVTNIAQIYASGLGYSAQLGSENLTNWSLLDPNDFSPGGGTGQTNWDFSSITNEPWVEESSIGTSAYSNSSAFYLSSNPNSYITIGDVPSQRTQWSVATVTNAGTVAYSNASAFDSSGAAQSVSNNLGTAAFHPATDFLGLHAKADTAGTADTALAGWPTTWALSSITDKGTAAYSNASAFYLSSNPSSYITLGDIPAQRTQWSVATVTNAGTAAYSNASAFDLSGVAGSATNKLDTDLRQAINDSTNVTFAPGRLATNSAAANQVLTATSSSTAAWQAPSTVFGVAMGGPTTGAYSSTAFYSNPWDSSSSTTENRSAIPWPQNSTLTNIYLYLSISPPAGTNVTATIFTNGVASAFAVTMTGTGAVNKATNTTTSVTVPPGVFVSVRIQGNNASASGNISIKWSFSYY